MATTTPTTMDGLNRKKQVMPLTKGAKRGRMHYLKEMDKELEVFLRRIGRQRRLEDKQMTLPGFEEMF